MRESHAWREAAAVFVSAQNLYSHYEQEVNEILTETLDLRLLAENAARKGSEAVIKSRAMNERQRSHVDYYLERLEYWKSRKPVSSTARLLAARDADEAHPLRTEEEAAKVVEYLRRLEQDQA